MTTTVFATEKLKKTRKIVFPRIHSLTNWLTHSFIHMLTSRGASTEDLIIEHNSLTRDLFFFKFKFLRKVYQGSLMQGWDLWTTPNTADLTYKISCIRGSLEIPSLNKIKKRSHQLYYVCTNAIICVITWCCMTSCWSPRGGWPAWCPWSRPPPPPPPGPPAPPGPPQSGTGCTAFHRTPATKRLY